jgi:hypothetical protein
VLRRGGSPEPPALGGGGGADPNVLRRGGRPEALRLGGGGWTDPGAELDDLGALDRDGPVGRFVWDPGVRGQRMHPSVSAGS